MKVKQLREILSADDITIFYDNEPHFFAKDMSSECNDYFSVEDVNVSLWDMYGEYEIEQLYDENEGIVIEIIGGK